MKKVVILISGRGSNMQALVEAERKGRFKNAKIVAVLSDREQAAGLKIAQNLGIATDCVSAKHFQNRPDFEAVLAQKIESYAPDVVVLAGFMRILSADFVQRFEHRLINIHPSLLPAFVGLNTHERAILAGVKIHGCTVHFVTADLDSGPIIIQAAVPVFPHDTPESLAQRVLEQEHQILPQALSWFLDNQLTICGKIVEIANSAKAGSVFPR